MVVQLPRNKRENIKTRRLNRLMYRRRLVHPPSYRLEVVDVENPRIQVTVPANNIQRVKVEDVGHESIVNLHTDLKLTTLLMRDQFLRPSKVPVTERRQLHQLTIIVPVATRHLHRPPRLRHQEPVLLPL